MSGEHCTSRTPLDSRRRSRRRPAATPGRSRSWWPTRCTARRRRQRRPRRPSRPKTGGNPFFTGQLLQTLHQEGLLRFDYRARRWRADLEGVGRMQIAESVVDLMAGKIRRLAGPTVEVLKQAACIGNRFDLETLAVVNRERTVPIGR